MHTNLLKDHVNQEVLVFCTLFCFAIGRRIDPRTLFTLSWHWHTRLSTSNLLHSSSMLKVETAFVTNHWTEIDQTNMVHNAYSAWQKCFWCKILTSSSLFLWEKTSLSFHENVCIWCINWSHHEKKTYLTLTLNVVTLLNCWYQLSSLP